MEYSLCRRIRAEIFAAFWYWFSGFVPLPSDGSDPAYCSSQSPVPSGWLLWCGQSPHPSPAFRPFSAAAASSVSAWIREDTAGLPQQVSSPGYLPAKIPDILIKGSAGALPDLHPYRAAPLRQSAHLVLKYSVYHNTGSREVSHVLFCKLPGCVIRILFHLQFFHLIPHFFCHILYIGRLGRNFFRVCGNR